MWLHKPQAPQSDARGGEAVLRVALALASATSPEAVLDTLAQELIGAVPRASECTISTWDPVSDQLVVSAISYRDPFPTAEDIGKRYDLADYPGLRELLRQRSGYNEYRVSDPAITPQVRAQLTEWEWQTWASFPLVVGGEAVGVVDVVDYNSSAPWDPADARLCQALASLAAGSVRNAQLVAELRDLADRDPLTGLLNHRAFYEALEQRHETAVRTGAPLAVLVADIDDFKSFNDAHGHLRGDETLRRVAQAIVQLTRSEDIAGRIGGDEFALALVNVAPADTESIAHRLITNVFEQTGLSASVGVTLAPTSSQTHLDIVELADNALRLAKTTGKNAVRIASAA